MTEMSPADMSAVMGNHMGYGYGYGFGGEFVWVILLIALLGGGFNNGRGSDVARIQDVYASNDLQSIRTAINNLGNGIADATFALNNNILNQSNLLQRDMFGGFNNVQFAVEGVKDAVKDCCCTTQRNIDSVRYDNSQNTFAITKAIHDEGEATRALIAKNEIQALRDKLAEQSQIIQSTQFAVSQQAQNQAIIGALRPAPVPAYQVQSPYVSTYNGCGCLY